ncbi:GyrI-like domain-containing protein [Allomuricauda sp. F6463D]|uniref:GyrI-like domain-containing protein n=1 Tax=Allomuricauda sp. F6463D TaxID=2926409 RepID=UPI001FF3D936|nr:GyrI-like domain-containing protein [Muricauda sp. F6463D]MCK0161416.1 GyrI-like domain-containing protein [Muricauda sp. F6463D]
MVPRIETLPITKLIGKKLNTSFANDKTVELWRSFSPRKAEIKNAIGSDLYSVEIYPKTHFFQNFQPTAVFEKWAAITVSDYNNVPEGMDTLTIPSGTYAVFHYKGKPSEAMDMFRYIYADWLPNSGFNMDKRPYFALMGAKYKGEHPESEEEFWIPIKEK